MVTDQIDIGQEFRAVERNLFGYAPRIWMVVRLFTGLDQRRYAVIVSTDMTREEKTLAATVIADTRKFERVTTTAASRS
jgi:nicotinamide mononucleotide adenylyltransferase